MGFEFRQDLQARVRLFLIYILSKFKILFFRKKINTDSINRLVSPVYNRKPFIKKHKMCNKFPLLHHTAEGQCARARCIRMRSVDKIIFLIRRASHHLYRIAAPLTTSLSHPVDIDCALHTYPARHWSIGPKRRQCATTPPLGASVEHPHTCCTTEPEPEVGLYM